jgi:hypothetical protein
MKTQYESYLQGIIYYVTPLLVLLLPVLIIPFFGIGFLYAKFGLTYIVLCCGFLALFLCKVIYKKNVLSIGWYGRLLALLLVTSGLSSFFSLDSRQSFFSGGVDTDTFFFTLLAVSVGFFATMFGRLSRKTIEAHLLGFVYFSGVLALFYDIRFFGGTSFLSLGVFDRLSANTVGSLSDLSIIVSVGFLISLSALEFFTLSRLKKKLVHFFILSQVVLMLVSNFKIIPQLFGTTGYISWVLFVNFFVVIVGVYGYKESKKIPKTASCAFLVLTLCVIFAGPLSEKINTRVGFTADERVDVRVGASASLSLIENTYAQDFSQMLLGSGPNTYYMLWSQYKPTELPYSVNITPYWNTDFNSGFSFIATVAGSNGLLGFLLWLALIGFIKLTWYRRFQQSDAVAFLLATISFFFATLLFFYNPGPVIVWYAFICWGISFGACGEYAKKTELTDVVCVSAEYDNGHSRGVRAVLYLGGIVGLVVFISISYFFVRCLIASNHAHLALDIVYKNPEAILLAERELTTALTFDQSNTYFRFLSELALVGPSNLVTEKQTTAVTPEILNQLQISVRNAELAVRKNKGSKDYRDWLQLGRVYEVSTFLGSTSTAALSYDAYAKAAVLAPTNPAPLYYLARLHLYAKDDAGAYELVKRSLLLKPNYTEALALFDMLRATNSQSSDKIHTAW